MKLNDTKCRNLKPQAKAYNATDGAGMYLKVNPDGSKYWRMNYRFMGKQDTLAIGVYPTVSLKEARQAREDAKKLLAKGINPSQAKKQARLELVAEHGNTFEGLAREWHEQHKHTWKPKHGANVLKRLETNIFPYFASVPIKNIRAVQILAAIRKVEARGNNDLAHRIMQGCSQVFRYAVATGRAEKDITQELQGSLQPVKTKHHKFLNGNELPPFLAELEQYDSKYQGNILTKLAFKLLILTFLRSNEIRGAKWDEIDWDKQQWKVPAERMKMPQTHIIPLAKQSIAILKQLQEITSHNHSNFVFPNQHNPSKYMSENTFLKAIEIMGYKGRTTAHGFRSVASTALNEHGFNRDVIEIQLAHAERNQVRAAYNYAEHLPARHEMMQWYADFIDGARG